MTKIVTILLFSGLFLGCADKPEVYVTSSSSFDPNTPHTLEITDCDYTIVVEEPNLLVLDVWSHDETTKSLNPNIDVSVLRRVRLNYKYEVMERGAKNLLIKELR